MYKYCLNYKKGGSGARNVKAIDINPDLKVGSDHYKSQIAAPPALLNEITKTKSYSRLLHAGRVLIL